MGGGGAWTDCRFKGRDLAKKRGSGVLESGGDTPVHSMVIYKVSSRIRKLSLCKK